MIAARAPHPKILLVDPSLFTAPYDARLSEGLTAVGLMPIWATRRLRAGEEDELGGVERLPFFYPLTDGPRRRTGKLWRAAKGVEHLLGLRQLWRVAWRQRPGILHFHWLPLPRFDARAIARLRRVAPVVVTVHDTLPFNGKTVHALQRDAFDKALALADRLIVHTAAGQNALVERGHDAARIAVVPHGRLATGSSPAQERASNARWRVVQFGKIQDYKGVDVLVEALGKLDPDTRARLEVVVAGEALIDLAPLRDRARALGIDERALVFRDNYLSNAEVEALIASADAFVFPYRAIEASGVLLLVADASRWIVASDLGAFAELIGRDGSAGSLVPPGDPAALATALVDAIGRRPTRRIGDAVPDWAAIGAMTREVYRDAASHWQATRR